jgi:hypothetical protein
MKLRLFIILVLTSALLAPGAAAGLSLQTQVRKGMQTTSRSATGSCGFRNNYYGRDDLLVFCKGSSGRARARYDFYLPKNLYGRPAMHVYSTKLCCASSRIRKRLVVVTRRHYRVILSVSHVTRLDVRSVSLSYYVRT